MKKLTSFLFAILAVAVVSILFTSCEEQPGVYKPKKKISKVYQQEAGEVEYLKEEWIWDGNKVSSISYYDEGELQAKDEFIYEGDRLSKIRTEDGFYTDYFYADKKFEKIKCYNPNGALLTEISFQYGGKKISTITFDNYQVCKKMISMIERGFMGKLISEEGMKIVAEKLANTTKGTTTMNFSYEGENLSSVAIENPAESFDITFADYDAHSNVMYNFFPYVSYKDLNYYVFGKNNPGKETYHYSNNVSITAYNYTYDGDFPLIIQANSFSGEGTLLTTKITRLEYN